MMTKGGGRIGNPPYIATDEKRAEVRAMAKVATRETIAAYLGISAMTLDRHYGKEFKEGQAEAVQAVGAKLVASALEGNTTAQIFFLRTRGKWNTRTEIVGPDGGPVRHVDMTRLLEGKTEEELELLEQTLAQLSSDASSEPQPDGD